MARQIELSTLEVEGGAIVQTDKVRLIISVLGPSDCARLVDYIKPIKMCDPKLEEIIELLTTLFPWSVSLLR